MSAKQQAILALLLVSAFFGFTRGQDAGVHDALLQVAAREAGQ